MGEANKEFDERPGINNELSGEVHGPVGQFGIVHGDVNLTPNLSGELARAVEEGLARREAAKAEEVSSQREAAAARERQIFHGGKIRRTFQLLRYIFYLTVLIVWTVGAVRALRQLP